MKFEFASVNNLLDDWTFDQRRTQRQTVEVELTGRTQIRNCVGEAARTVSGDETRNKGSNRRKEVKFRLGKQMTDDDRPWKNQAHEETAWKRV